MDMNLFFRLSFIALWALLGVIRGYYGRKTKTHSTLADVKAKLQTAIAEEGMGTGFKIITALITVIGAAGLALYIISPPWWTWTSILLGEWIQWLGILIALVPVFFLSGFTGTWTNNGP